MWSLSGGGDGYDMLGLQSNLLELFEESAADGKGVLEITGEDVAAFCDELLRNAKTWTENHRDTLNRDILRKLGKGKA
jgi:DNA-binding ferritin-like protein (Dps family)